MSKFCQKAWRNKRFSSWSAVNPHSVSTVSPERGGDSIDNMQLNVADGSLRDRCSLLTARISSDVKSIPVDCSSRLTVVSNWLALY